MNESYHGTYSGYVYHKCRQSCCLAAHREYNRRQRRLAAYGQWSPFVDAEPARRHVQQLQAEGLGAPTIAELAGVNETYLRRLLRGDSWRGTGPTKRIRPETAQRILAVRSSLEVYPDEATIDGTGTRRRLQALVSLGWTQKRLSEQLGMRLNAANRIIQGSSAVRAATARAVRDLYDRMWDAAPPEGTPLEASTARRARAIAARHGWVPPLAWDDDTIDDPAAEPAGAGPSPVRRGGARLPEADELLWLVDECRETPEAIADRFGVTVGGVAERVRRARGQVAA